MEPINVHEYEELARQCLPQEFWDYYQGGSEDELTLQANRSALVRMRLRPRVLRDVSTVDMTTSVLGCPIRFPLMIAPTAFHRLAHPDGERATAAAAHAMNTIMVTSTFASYHLEDIVECSQGACWLQLYIYQDLTVTGKLVERADRAGCRAIVLTVDVARLGRRERDLRNHFTLPDTLSIPNFEDVQVAGQYLPPPICPTWETVRWLRSITSLPLLLKGIVTAEDALLAMEAQVDGIIVSNHGGRQLDGMVASIEALPEVVQAVAGRKEVYLDGGIRRGTDILKALALGARAVLIGRPALWGLAVDGQQGVEHVLSLLEKELELAMALTGCPTIDAIEPSLVKV